MKLLKPLSIVAIALLVAVVFAGLVTAPAAAQNDAMQYRFDAAHTGDYSPVAGTAPMNDHVQWSTGIGSAFRSSPAIWNGLAFVGGWNGTLYAFDAANGSVVWSRETPHRFYQWPSKVDSSPAVVGGVLYATNDDGWVGAMDPATGAVKWDTVLPYYEPVMASPAVANGFVWVVTNNGLGYKLNASYGNIIYSDPQDNVPWWFGGLQSPAYSSPAVVNNVLYVGDGQGIVYAINTTTPQLLWTNTTGGPISHSSPVVANGQVFIENQTGYLLALSTADGHQFWSTQIGNGQLDTSPAVANGKVYVSSALPGSNRATVSAFDMNGNLVWQTQTPQQGYQDVGGSESSPAYANGMLYVGGIARTPPPGPGGDITALNATTGNIVWQQLVSGTVNTAPAVYNGVVYAADDNGVMTAIGPPTAATTLIASAPATSPATFTVQGRLTASGVSSHGLTASTAGLAGATITLRRSTDNVTYTNVTTTSSDGSGTYRFRTSVPAAGTYYYRTAYDGNDNGYYVYAAATSNTVKVTVTSIPPGPSVLPKGR